MASDPSDGPSSELVELSREECLRLLGSHSFGRLAVSQGDGAPLIRPVNYAFDERSQSVVFRTGHGSKFHVLPRLANAAFEIDGIDEASRTGWSVVMRGVTDEVVGATEIRRLDTLGLELGARGQAALDVHSRLDRVRSAHRPGAAGSGSISFEASVVFRNDRSVSCGCQHPRRCLRYSP